MAEVTVWYLHLRSVHIGLVLASGALFAVRGALVLAGQGWAMARPWRLLSYGIDTLLLAAGVALWALLVFGFMASVALAHHPMGFLQLVMAHAR